MNLKTIRKALVAPVIAVVLAGLALLGVGVDITVGEAVALVVTGVLTYLIPNEG